MKNISLWFFINYESNICSLKKTHCWQLSFIPIIPFPLHPCRLLSSFSVSASVVVIWFIGFKIIGKFYLKLLSLTPTVSRGKIHRMCPDCPSPSSIDLSDPSVLEAATESLAKYNQESPLKLYSLVKVTRASSQVRLKCPLPPTVCLRTCSRFLNLEERIKALLLIRTQETFFTPYFSRRMHIQLRFDFWVILWDFHKTCGIYFYLIALKVIIEMDS